MAVIIDIEGTDGSGKETQAKLLLSELEKRGKVCLMQSFPNYNSLSSGAVKMYLSGEFGENASDIDPYQASMFFAVDRLCTMKLLEQKLKNIDYLILDRYTQSNMIHQACKFSDVEKRDKLLDWINTLEFETLKLPKPNIVLFLDLPTEYSKKLANMRNELKNGKSKDIHENDYNHLLHAYKTGKAVGEKFGWKFINCVENEQIKSIEQIHNEIMDIVDKI